MTKPDDFASPDDLEQDGREYHNQIAVYLAGVWMKDPPLSLTVAEALTQAAMHSHYHRGQNATRLRELGGNPPPTDLIVWHWKGRPAPAWQLGRAV